MEYGSSETLPVSIRYVSERSMELRRAAAVLEAVAVVAREAEPYPRVLCGQAFRSFRIGPKRLR